MHITFLGGGDEIGASCAIVEIGSGRVLVDCGIRMTGENRLPDLAVVTAPEFKGIDAVILTHAHLDHSGARPVFDPCVRLPGRGMLLKMSELELANELLEDAKLLLDNGCHRSSVSRSYYAAYHASIALLESLGLRPNNFIGRDKRPAKRWEHGIVIRQVTINSRVVNILTIKLASRLRWMYSLRIRGDYRCDLSVSPYSAQSSYEAAQQIVAKVEEQL